MRLVRPQDIAADGLASIAQAVRSEVDVPLPRLAGRGKVRLRQQPELDVLRARPEARVVEVPVQLVEDSGMGCGRETDPGECAKVVAAETRLEASGERLIRKQRVEMHGRLGNAYALLPGHTSPAEFLVPELVKRGRTADADKVYRAAAEVLDKLCQDYPQSALFHNNRAWLAARCRRDLPQATEHAQKAVILLPSSASYQETLAETRFQAGDKAGALAAITKALDVDPKNRGMAQRKARIEAGDPNAPLPEGR